MRVVISPTRHYLYYTKMKSILLGMDILGMKQVEAGFNAATSNVCHLGRGSVYTPDAVLDPSRNPLQKGQRDDLMTKIQSGDKTLKDVRVMVKMIYDEGKKFGVWIFQEQLRRKRRR